MWSASIIILWAVDLVFFNSSFHILLLTHWIHGLNWYELQKLQYHFDGFYYSPFNIVLP